MSSEFRLCTLRKKVKFVCIIAFTSIIMYCVITFGGYSDGLAERAHAIHVLLDKNAGLIPGVMLAGVTSFVLLIIAMCKKCAKAARS